MLKSVTAPTKKTAGAKKPSNIFPKHRLMRHGNQIAQMKKDDHILYLANKQFFEYFLKHNQTELFKLEDAVLELDKKYFVRDEKGVFVNANNEPLKKDEMAVPLPGMTFEEYDKEYNLLMNEEVVIKYL